MNIIWELAPRTSILHALWAAGSGRPLADPRLTRPVLEAAAAFHRALLQIGLPADAFWQHALPLAGQISAAEALLSATLTACGLPQDAYPAAVSLLVPLLKAAERQVTAVWPSAAEELTLRHRPLREQWEARGLGLLAWLRRQFPGLEASSACRVLGVLPVLGGGGWLHRAEQAVRIECVLANPRSDLPEVVRLAWLIAQATCAWPAEVHGKHDASWLAACALLPATLAAAEDLELAACTEPVVAAAVASWSVPDTCPSSTRLWAWWQQTAGRPCPWPEALRTLQRTLDGPGSSDRWWRARRG
jgi:hypothetical protein